MLQMRMLHANTSKHKCISTVFAHATKHRFTWFQVRLKAFGAKARATHHCPTPLMWAVRSRNAEVRAGLVARAITGGGDEDHNPKCVFSVALLQAVELLLSEGCEVNTCNRSQHVSQGW